MACRAARVIASFATGVAGVARWIRRWEGQHNVGLWCRAAPVTDTPGYECPPARAFGAGLLLDFVPRGIRTRVETSPGITETESRAPATRSFAGRIAHSGSGPYQARIHAVGQANPAIGRASCR